MGFLRLQGVPKRRFTEPTWCLGASYVDQLSTPRTRSAGGRWSSLLFDRDALGAGPRICSAPRRITLGDGLSPKTLKRSRLPTARFQRTLLHFPRPSCPLVRTKLQPPRLPKAEASGGPTSRSEPSRGGVRLPDSGFLRMSGIQATAFARCQIRIPNLRINATIARFFSRR